MAQAATDVSQTPQRAGFGRRVGGALIRRREASILLVLVGLVVYFSFRTEAFFGADNARVIAEYSAPIAIIEFVDRDVAAKGQDSGPVMTDEELEAA